MRAQFLGWFLIVVGTAILLWPRLNKKRPQINVFVDRFMWGYDPSLLRYFLAIIYLILGSVLINWHTLLTEVFSNIISFCVVGLVFCVLLFFAQCKTLIRIEQANTNYQKDAISIQRVLYAAIVVICLLQAWLLYQYFHV